MITVHCTVTTEYTIYSEADFIKFCRKVAKENNDKDVIIETAMQAIEYINTSSPTLVIANIEAVVISHQLPLQEILRSGNGALTLSSIVKILKGNAQLLFEVKNQKTKKTSMWLELQAAVNKFNSELPTAQW